MTQRDSDPEIDAIFQAESAKKANAVGGIIIGGMLLVFVFLGFVAYIMANLHFP